MKQFGGFPAKMQFTPLPNLFFSALLPEIDDISELKVTLHLFEALYRKRGYPRFVTYGELLGNTSLANSLRQIAGPHETVLSQALAKATQRGTFLQLTLARDGTQETLYFLNTASERQTVARIQSGEIDVGGLKPAPQTCIDTEEQPDIFTLYEQNIGLLTPMIAEELREAEKLYPTVWIQDAIKEAIDLNKRSWRYISRILERWASEGRNSGAYRRHSTKGTDPDKYVKGKYGHMVRR